MLFHAIIPNIIQIFKSHDIFNTIFMNQQHHPPLILLSESDAIEHSNSLCSMRTAGERDSSWNDGGKLDTCLRYKYILSRVSSELSQTLCPIAINQSVKQVCYNVDERSYSQINPIAQRPYTTFLCVPIIQISNLIHKSTHSCSGTILDVPQNITERIAH